MVKCLCVGLRPLGWLRWGAVACWGAVGLLGGGGVLGGGGPLGGGGVLGSSAWVGPRPLGWPRLAVAMGLEFMGCGSWAAAQW